MGLRAVWQPILPYVGLSQSVDRCWNTVDYSDTSEPSSVKPPIPNPVALPLAPAQALRAVDPSKPAAALPNANYPAAGWINPDEETADVVFPGIEKHPFLTECFFGWVYPATTTDESDEIKPAVVKVKPKVPPDVSCPDPLNKNSKFVAVVNGKIGTDGAVIDQNAGAPGTPSIDLKRDEMNEIRTPVLVVQVANPWNEPIRLGDFRLEIFGQRYDFPDYEVDGKGDIILDANAASTVDAEPRHRDRARDRHGVPDRERAW